METTHNFHTRIDPSVLADHYGPAESIVVSGLETSIKDDSESLTHCRANFLVNCRILVNYLSPPSGVSFKDAFLHAKSCWKP